MVLDRSDSTWIRAFGPCSLLLPLPRAIPLEHHLQAPQVFRPLSWRLRCDPSMPLILEQLTPCNSQISMLCVRVRLQSSIVNQIDLFLHPSCSVQLLQNLSRRSHFLSLPSNGTTLPHYSLLPSSSLHINALAVRAPTPAVKSMLTK